MKYVEISKFREKIFWEGGFFDVRVDGWDDFGFDKLSDSLSYFLNKKSNTFSSAVNISDNLRKSKEEST